MKRRIAGFILVSISLTMIGGYVYSHCEVPCGIYSDETRITLIQEHTTTIEKAMNQIIALSKENALNHNQIVRWVNTKEEHANKVQQIVTQYFMTQRVKPTDEKDAKKHADYIQQLTLLHGMLVTAMKTKQSTDLEQVTKLRDLTGRFESAYFKK